MKAIKENQKTFETIKSYNEKIEHLIQVKQGIQASNDMNKLQQEHIISQLEIKIQQFSELKSVCIKRLEKRELNVDFLFSTFSNGAELYPEKAALNN